MSTQQQPQSLAEWLQRELDAQVGAARTPLVREDAFLRHVRESAARELGLDPTASAAVDLRDKLHFYRERNRNTPDLRLRGSPLARTVIPTSELTETQLQAAGFFPTSVAVPERGQSTFRTWRHPFGGMHLHRHDRDWIFHEDKHDSLAQVTRRIGHQYADRSPLERFQAKSKAILTDVIPHVAYEGVPGYINYLSGLGLGTPTLSRKLQAQRAERLNALLENRPVRELDFAPGPVNYMRGAALAALLGVGSGMLGGRDMGVRVGGATAGFLAGSEVGNRMLENMRASGRTVEGPAALLTSALPTIAGTAAGYFGGRLLTRKYKNKEDQKDD